ncbi:polyphenol oxidase family protein [Nocardioides nanhaiensis]|uniref:Peptidoglycan editing factor PgeF n=1 Tax=Nocardioides nanhaiensis TaxID=1476871 RepID=A0ABP8WUN4_9ACTN
MFWFREQYRPDAERRGVGVAFTDASLDVQGTRPGFPGVLDRLVAETGVRGFGRANQVHGDTVVHLTEPSPPPQASPGLFPDADALVTATPGLGLMVRVADCVPVLLADTRAGVVGVAHAGRAGVVLGVVERAVAAMAELGARELRAWIGPHVCGACYEVPAAMREEVERRRPGTAATTRWGTPSIDLAAGVRAQLDALGAHVVEVGGCTLEEPRLHSYRRDGAASGRLGGLVWLTQAEATEGAG